MKLTDIHIESEWSHRGTNSTFHFVCGVVPKSILYTKLSGAMNEEEYEPSKSCIATVFAGGYLDNCEYIRVTDYSEVVGSPKFDRQDFAQTIREIHEKHRCCSKVSIICGASPRVQAECRLLSSTAHCSYLYVNTVEEAFELVERGDFSEPKEGDDEIVLQSEDIYDFKCEMGRVLFGEDPFGRDVVYAAERPLSFVFDVLKVAKADIEDLKMIEKKYRVELENTLKQHQMLLDNIRTQVWFLTDPRTFGRVNQAYARFHGKRIDEIDHCDIYEILPAKIANLCEQANRSVFEKKEAIQYEEWIPGHDGIPRLLSVEKIPILGDDDEIQHVVCAAIDISDRKQAETNLIKEKEKFQHVINSVSEAIYVLNNEFCFIDINRGAERMYGYSKTEIVGKDPSFLSAPGRNNLVETQEAMERVMYSGKSEHFDFWGLRKDGSIFPKEVILNRGRFDDQYVVIVTARDVSDQLKSVEALREAEENLRLIVENTLDLICLINSRNQIVFANESISPILGFEKSEIMDERISEFLSDKEFRKLRLIFLKAVEQGTVEKCESQIFHKNGHLVDVEVIAKSIVYHGETVIQSTIHDISNRKKVEREMAYQSAFRQLLMDLSSTFINLPLDESDAAINHALKELCEFVGADRSYIFEYNFDANTSSNTYEYCGEGIVSVIDDLQDLSNEILADWVALHVKGKWVEIEIVDSMPDSDLRILLQEQCIQSLIAVPIFQGSDCFGFVGFDSVLQTHRYSEDEKQMIKVFAQMLWNVTQRMREEANRIELNKTLENALKKAEQSDHLKSAFLANMSHEIRTPLNGILGFSSLLEDDVESWEIVNDYAQTITNSGNHLLNIINDIIHLSKMDAGYVKAIQAPLNVSGLVEELGGLFKEQVSSKKSPIEFRVVVPEGNDVWALSDVTRLRQILENLLGNALKFTSTGFIELSFRIEKDKLLFQVADSGIGIPLEKQGTIFDRFVQANANTEQLYGGTGLGLSISKSCVELLGGDIWLQSEFGRGSTFNFYIEYVPYTKMSVHSSKQEGEGTFNGEHILVAEDDDMSYAYLETILKSKGFQLSRTSTGISTVEKALSDDSLKLILMDINMPQQNGLEAARMIKSKIPNIPIIAQTAYAFGDDRKKCTDAGCDDYISKPILKDRLFHMLRQYL